MRYKESTRQSRYRFLAPRFQTPVLAMLLLLLSLAPALAGQSTTPPDALPVPGMVTMIDLGAGKCIPCKMMAPILAQAEIDYRGRATVAFIDVWELPEQAKRFNIRIIPTQIFFTAQGKEALRHEGFMDRAGIDKVLTRLGVK